MWTCSLLSLYTLLPLYLSVLHVLLATQMTLSLGLGHHSTSRRVCHLFIFNFVLIIVFTFFLGATLVILSSQFTIVLKFFLSHNLRNARKCAWDLTVTSRGKGRAFWQPYVEEWDQPPKVNVNQWAGLAEVKGKVLRFAIKHCKFADSF